MPLVRGRWPRPSRPPIICCSAVTATSTPRTGAIEMQPEPYDATSDTMIEALYNLGWVCYFGGRAELWVPFHRALASLVPGIPESLVLLSATFDDPARTALGALDQID